MRRLLQRLFGRRRSRIAGAAKDAVAGRRGLEVGGASRIFSAKGRIPLYPVIRALDGADFSTATRWQSNTDRAPGYAWAPDRPAGQLFVCEASDLEPVPDESYDFLLASHVLEHTANPLGALRTWQRTLRPGGFLVLVVPHREGTFDHRRDVTEFAHLEADLDAGTTEDDLTHVEEVIERHDLSRDPGVETKEELEARSRANPDNRCLHHHVFDTALVLRALDRAGWAIRGSDTMLPYHIAVLAQRPSDELPPDNGAFLAAAAAWRHRSPFVGDR